MDTQYDIIILGGGISGLGLLQQASAWGLRALLLEREPSLGSETSAASLRIMHGGFRYLQTMDLARAIESIRAQAELLARYPTMVKPLPCVAPLQRHGLRSRLPATAALHFYEALKHAVNPPYMLIKGRVTSAELAKEIPLLSGQLSAGALVWWDALLHSPAELFAALRNDAVTHGAELRLGATVLSVHPQKSHTEVRYLCDGQSQMASADLVINAAGSGMHSFSAEGVKRREVKWCKGFNILLNRQIESTYGVGGQAKGRLLFSVPRHQQSAIGTWYIPIDTTEQRPLVSSQELSSAISDFNVAFPNAQITQNDIAETEVGLLPMRGIDREGNPKLYGREQLYVYHRYIEVLSTKFTTFAEQARRTLLAGRKFLRL